MNFSTVLDFCAQIKNKGVAKPLFIEAYPTTILRNMKRRMNNMVKKIKQTPLTQGVDLRDWLKTQPQKFQAQVWKQSKKKPSKKKREG